MSIKKYFNQIDRNTGRLTKKAEKRVLSAYRSSLKELRALMSAQYSKYAVGEQLTFSEMAKYNRKEKMFKEIQSEINRMTRGKAATTRQMAGDIYEQSYYRAGFALEKGTQAKLSYTQLPREQIAASVQNPISGLGLNERISRNRQLLISRCREQITQGMVQGEGYVKMTARIKDVYDKDATGAMRILRTEGHRNQQMGTADSIEHAEELGVKVKKIWDATVDGDTREDHADMDGREADKDGLFTLPDGSRGEAPGLTGEASQDINCFPGDMYVYSPNKLKAATKRYYQGKLVRIKTASGIDVSATPNHPILTDKGWVGIGSIKEGDNVVNATFRNTSIGSPNPNNSPTTFTEAFSFANIMSSGLIKRIAGVRPQFHGDGFEGQVYVVPLKSKLRNTLKSLLTYTALQLKFSSTEFRKLSLFSNGGLIHLFRVSFSSSNRIMGSLRKSFAFFFRSVSHSVIHCLASIPGFNIFRKKNTPNNSTGYIENFCKGLFRLSREVSLDKVVSVDSSNFCGHIFNLHVNNSWYITNAIVPQNSRDVKGLVSHNCRCSVRAEIDGYKPEFRRTREEGIIPYETYREWEENRLGKGGT